MKTIVLFTNNVGSLAYPVEWDGRSLRLIPFSEMLDRMESGEIPPTATAAVMSCWWKALRPDRKIYYGVNLRNAVAAAINYRERLSLLLSAHPCNYYNHHPFFR